MKGGDKLTGLRDDQWRQVEDALGAWLFWPVPACEVVQASGSASPSRAKSTTQWPCDAVIMSYYTQDLAMYRLCCSLCKLPDKARRPARPSVVLHLPKTSLGLDKAGACGRFLLPF